MDGANSSNIRSLTPSKTTNQRGIGWNNLLGERNRANESDTLEDDDLLLLVYDNENEDQEKEEDEGCQQDFLPKQELDPKTPPGNRSSFYRLGEENKENRKTLLRVACTTGKKRGSFRRHFRGLGKGDVESSLVQITADCRRLKPCNVFTPLGKLRAPQLIESGTDSDWRSVLSNSFEVNQSFPRIANKRERRRRDDTERHLDQLLKTPLRTHRVGLFGTGRKGGAVSAATAPKNVSVTTTGGKHQRSTVAYMDRVRVDGANGLRFSALRPKGGCLTHGVSSPYNNSYVASTSESIGRLPKSGINPNKAIFTIDAKSSQILIVNRNACDLLGYSSKELCEMQFASLLPNKNKMHVSALAEGQLNSEDGTVIILSGKVVELCTKSGENVAVSLWVRQIDDESRCLAVAEPVERRVAQLLVDKAGYVISGDYEALMLFQLDSIDKFNGMDVSLLIPAIQLPDADNSMIAKHIRKQKATGKTAEGVAFPVCLMIAHHDSGTDTTDSGLSNANHLFVITIWVFTNLSGLIVIDENSVIESCNHHFSMLMFGYPQSKIIGEHITKILPNFGQECDYLGFMNRSRNATLSSLDNDESETETDHVDFENKDEFINNAINSMKNAPDAMSSPMKESRKICLDFTSTSVSNSRTANNTDTMSISLTSAPVPPESSAFPGPPEKDRRSPRAHDAKSTSPGLLSSIIVSSVPENLLSLDGVNSENDRNYANLTSSVSCSALKATGSAAATLPKENLTKPTPLEDCSILPDCDLLTPVNDTSKCLNMLGKNLSIESNTSSKEQLYSTEDINTALLKGSPGRDYSMAPPMSAPPTTTTPRYVKPYELAKTMVTSTPDQHKRHSAAGVPPNAVSSGHRRSFYSDGKYRGEAVHYDGNVIDILYTISNQTLPCGRKVYCIWISRDPDSSYNNLEDEEKHQNLTLTFNSVTSTVDNSLGQAIKNTATAQHSDRPSSVSRMSQCDEDLTHGEYSKYYTLVKHIGKGAYGYVKLSYRNSDRLLVISKFILKEKLVPQFMINTEDNREIPMEVYLLMHVKHPNIVNMFDWFENDKFFQVVMEIHGSGMDLFEFIDRRPVMTEKLACHIFRQIANAVAFLHSLNILHRDIKDENVIIDHNFHIKLIDFGSATFVQEGQLFSTFYGTTEYCSPEVLAGNRYSGPELEMWALGVTLYVLMFFENPFVDVEEILRSELIIPHEISEELEYVLLSLLDKNPKTRVTIKELLETEWMTQEINPAQFNFAKIIPCEPFETNPEKYWADPNICSSQTGLSTSPHSLSLVDDDVDGDDDDAHMDDSFIDPDELDDDVCQLSHDEELPPNRSVDCSDRDVRVLSTGLTSLSLREPDGTCISLVDGTSDRRSQSAMMTVGSTAHPSASNNCTGRRKLISNGDDTTLNESCCCDVTNQSTRGGEDVDGVEEDPNDSSEGDILLVVLDDDDDDNDHDLVDDLSRDATSEELESSHMASSTQQNGSSNCRPVPVYRSPSKSDRQRRHRRRAWETSSGAGVRHHQSMPAVVLDEDLLLVAEQDDVTCEDINSTTDGYEYANESFDEDVEDAETSNLDLS
ncbi:PAS domain-containing serine/threonine-protein kinase [Uranotaenia lowii]|uniref:PAS domain-containing serine/threonine-protein kinase n=1 Tax=Uranotaenia lowii TaxID=190385 RepID=UPI0024786BF7|nr:PAS domain-containing serine/threonine-protein kinase [Uranotaenia lowii]